LAAALGLSQLMAAVPAAYDLVRFAGAAYLAFLAWKALTSSSSPLAPDEALTPTPLLRIFRQGLVTNLLNPKMALFVLALFPQFVDPTKGSLVVQMLAFATILNAIGLIVNGAVILLASKVGSKLASNASIAKRLNQLLGVVFIGLATRLALFSGK
jgi:threonine/homoserine/homoserine lactone efflux protein